MAQTHLEVVADTRASVQTLLLQRQLLPWLGLQGGTRLAGASEGAALGAVSHLHRTGRLLGLLIVAGPISSKDNCHRARPAPSCVWVCARLSRQRLLEGPTELHWSSSETAAYLA